MRYRFGSGIDVHRFCSGRPLILGGVTIPFDKGLQGHSDADVLTHAIIDALLGASALGDIGTHFPDTDAQYKDISSLILLEKTREMVVSVGFRVSQIDATVITQAPRLLPFIPEIRHSLADCLQIPVGDISVKAKTTEGLGFIGSGEGIAALATVTLITL